DADGTNWSIYKNRFKFAADVAGLATHLDPANFHQRCCSRRIPEGVEDFEGGRAIIKQAIASTIPDALFLRVQATTIAAEL
ncbi:hypothetical protein R3P38DRAFT_2414545, partial [Favolaschia claudopus]